jgi:transcription antitermination factor NusB
MKGRRQARRAALQGLYELDQTHHPLETVLSARVASLCESALDSALPGPLRPVSRSALAVWDGQPLDEAGLAAVGSATGAGARDVAAIADVLNQLSPQVTYLRELVCGVMRNEATLDGAIHIIAPEWPVEQMAPVDRNVLRIALWEISTAASPTRVAINEAVELARAFSGEGARRMVNGALGTFVSGGRQLDLAREAAPCPP